MSSEPRRPSTVLEPAETELLRRALGEWGGPARASDDLARAMGFADVTAMDLELPELRRALRQDAPLSARDWARALVATEFVFVSDLYGSGTDWRTTTGRDDDETINALRVIQRKLGPIVQPHYGGHALHRADEGSR
ncbi:hypothetical protein ACFT5B_15485 [Luteimicrobium sp. NPDC057192]|uniref:hypothetical protein n=1 Tax=Luteimicrobium sp. NPDC057192 TaxID=3346042 RepID=UPI00363E5F5B